MTTDEPERVFLARSARNLSIEKAAKEMGIPKSTLTDFNRGDHVSARASALITSWAERQPPPAPVDPSEVWREIPGYSGYYEASNHGRIRSVERLIDHPHSGPIRIRSRILRQAPHRFGHLWVDLAGPDRSGTRQVHQLVLETFVGPKPEGMVGCHFDGNPQNNRLENLRWDTQSANLMDAMRHGTHPTLARKRKLSARSEGEDQ